MHDNWLTFWKDQDATIRKNGLVHFGNETVNIRNTPLIASLSDFAILAITGDDRHSFLHAQFINDLNLIKKPAVQLSAWCTQKGLVITNFLIINAGIRYLLICKQDQKEFVQKRLGMFVFRDKVTIEDISETSPLIGIANIKNLSLLAPGILEKPRSVTVHQELTMAYHPDNSGRYFIIGSHERLINKLHELKNVFTFCNSSIWNLLDILSGFPWISSATQEQFLPQMLNLDALNGLSYRKGCYPGQEIIARLHYRGKTKKRLQLITAEQPLQTGDFVHLQDVNAKVGTVINAESYPRDLFYALAVIELDKLNAQLYANNQKISLMKLPYTVEP